jgi:Tfp pilus assembly protein PilF
MIVSKRFTELLAAGTLMVLFAACATSGNGGSSKKDLSSTERAQLLVDIANGALNEGDATGALENLIRAEHEDSRLPELHHSKALAFFMKHDLQTATLEARKAVEIKPDYSDANNTLGKLLMDQGKADEAIAPLSRAANDPLYRDGFKPLTNLGILHYRRGEYARANEYFSRAIVGYTGTACVAYYYRGHIRLHEGHFREALNDYDAAGRKACAGFADAHLAMGIAYERSKQYDLARKKYLEIQSRFPNTKVADQAVSHLRFLP